MNNILSNFINLQPKLSLLLVTCAFFSHSLWAVGLSTYRIKLDNANPETNFIVFNKSIVAQQCKVDLKDILFNESGQKVEYSGSGVPAISAKKHVKYSPRRFELTGNGSQSIRFKYRRKRSAEPKEYRTYLSLLCEDVFDSNTSQLQVSLKPNLVINVPIILRTGDIPVQANFSKITYDKKKVTVEINKTGDRSIYGYLQLINKDTDEIIRSQKAFSMHAEVKIKSHEFMLEDYDLSMLDVVFIEDKNLSGDLTIRQSLE